MSLCQTLDSMSPVRTMYKILTLLSWSLEALFHGIWPTTTPSGQEWPPGPDRDRAGTPLADGHYTLLWSIQGDLDWYAKTMGLSHWRSHKPCWLCHADNDDTPLRWNNLSPDAPWHDHPRHMDDFLRDFPRARPLMQLPGMTLGRLSPDWMHLKHLGLDQRLLGSVLYLLVYQLGDGRPEDIMREVFAGIQAYYREHGVTSRFGKIKVSMFVNTERPHADYPKLKGKANEIRHLTPALLEVWQNWPKDNELMWDLVTATLQMSSALEEVVNSHEGFVLQDLEEEGHFHRTAPSLKRKEQEGTETKGPRKDRKIVKL